MSTATTTSTPIRKGDKVSIATSNGYTVRGRISDIMPSWYVVDNITTNGTEIVMFEDISTIDVV